MVWPRIETAGGFMPAEAVHAVRSVPRNSFRIASLAPIPLRLIVGAGFIDHGLLKLSRGPEVFAAVLQALGVPMPHFAAWLTIGTELVGGLAVLLGAFIPLVSVPLSVLLVVSIVTVHLPFGFSSIKLLAVTSAGPQFGKPGYETSLLYIACLAALVLGGTGPASVETLLRRKRKT
jgi:putative oxidoreductase